MWERACSRWDHWGLPARPRRRHRRQASAHRFCGVPRRCDLPGGRCGSGLARDRITAVYQPDRVAGIAGKPAPTGFVVSQDVVTCQGDDVGAGLLAIGSMRCARDTALSESRASPLPQNVRQQQATGLSRPCPCCAPRVAARDQSRAHARYGACRIPSCLYPGQFRT